MSRPGQNLSDSQNYITDQCIHFFLGSVAGKRVEGLSRDEEEFQKFMALELDPEERQRIDALCFGIIC